MSSRNRRDHRAGYRLGHRVLLQTDKSDVRHELTGATIQNMPLPGYRNYQSLLALVPGATPPAFQNAVVDTPGRALRSFVNGTATNNNTLVDGAREYQHMAAPPRRLRATLGIYRDREHLHRQLRRGTGHGRAAPASPLATKSGTNSLHGTGLVVQ